MDTDIFWELTGVLKGRVNRKSLRTLDRSLRALPPSDIVEYAKHLYAALDSLQTPGHLQQAVCDVGDPPDARVPLTDDALLYVSCAVVAAGREVYEGIVRNPLLLTGVWDFSEAEDLLLAPANAYEGATGEDWPWEYYGEHSATPEQQPWFRLPGMSWAVLEEDIPPDMDIGIDAHIWAEKRIIEDQILRNRLNDLDLESVEMIIEFSLEDPGKKVHNRIVKKQLRTLRFLRLDQIRELKLTSGDGLERYIRNSILETLNAIEMKNRRKPK